MNSTEPKSQVWLESLSTEETASEDIHDNRSVASDAVSQLSMRSNKRQHDTKKLLSTIQRLKQENMSLKDALDSTNVMDLATMKNKLRGANADLIRLRQTNSELRERIQTLEKKIFDMVTAERDKTEKSIEVIESKPTLQSVKEKLKFLKRSQLNKENQSQSHQEEDSNKAAALAGPNDTKSVPMDDIENSTISFQNPNAAGTVSYEYYLAMYNKSKHFERLARSLQARIDLQQAEAQNKNRETRDIRGPISSMTKTIQFAEAKEYTEINTTPNQLDKKLLLQQAKDANMIRELASEVKRLTSLLSRTMIEEEESMVSSAANDAIETFEKDDSSTHDNENFNIASKPSAVVVVHGYSLLFVICMFLVGVLVVLVPLVIRHLNVTVW